ncbi:MAG TPA: hypothetical protein VJ785_18935 [Anaerolineales bacterium]|nr:hypothetical protein [Anaerolineales bacterium]
MRSNNHVLLTVAILALAVLSCQAVTNLTGGGATATVPPQTTDNVILVDDFTSTNWGTGTDADSSIEYANETLQMIVFTKNWFVWSTPNDENYENVHMEVTAINNDTDPTTAFGIMCQQQEVDDSFYYFAITPAGQYAIAETSSTASDVFLTNDNQWQYSDNIPRNAESYRIGADCGNGELTLYVNDQQVDSVADDTYSNGGVALFVWSGEDVASANISFDDFLMTRLP